MKTLLAMYTIAAVLFGFVKLSEGDIKFYENKGFVFEAAKIAYANPKYIKDAVAFTFHPERDVYITYINATILHNWSNNVSADLQYYSVNNKAATFSIGLKLCDWAKMSWVTDLFYKISEVRSFCPVTKGTYHIRAELPKSLPVLIPPGAYRGSGGYYITKTKEPIIQIELNFKSRKTT